MPNLLKTFAADTPTQITGVRGANFSTAVIFSVSGFATNGLPVYSTGTIFLGRESGALPVQINTGSYFNWVLTPKAQGEDLANFWVRSQGPGGVYVIYYP